jgi:hypothetical protein
MNMENATATTHDCDLTPLSDEELTKVSGGMFVLTLCGDTPCISQGDLGSRPIDFGKGNGWD